MRKRDEADYIAFVEAAWPRLFRTAYALCGDYQMAEDALQSALVKAYGSWRRVHGGDNPEAYVRRIVVNQIRAWWRRKSHRAEYPADLTDHHRRVEPHEERFALTDQVWRALDTLPPRQRAVIVLRYFGDLSELEIAETLGVRPGTVKSQASVGLASLRATLRTAELVAEGETS